MFVWFSFPSCCYSAFMVLSLGSATVIFNPYAKRTMDTDPFSLCRFICECKRSCSIVRIATIHLSHIQYTRIVCIWCNVHYSVMCIITCSDITQQLFRLFFVIFLSAYTTFSRFLRPFRIPSHRFIFPRPFTLSPIHLIFLSL